MNGFEQRPRSSSSTSGARRAISRASSPPTSSTAPSRSARRAEPPAAVSLSVGVTVHLPDQPGEAPEAAIAHAERLLAAAGERLEPGDVLLTGSRIHVPVAPGDSVELDMGSLGRLGVRIVA